MPIPGCALQLIPTACGISLNPPVPRTDWDKGALSALGTEGCPGARYWTGHHKSSGPVSFEGPGTGETGVCAGSTGVCGAGCNHQGTSNRATREQQRPGSRWVRSAPAGIHMVWVSLQLCLSSCHGRAHQQPLPVSFPTDCALAWPGNLPGGVPAHFPPPMALPFLIQQLWGSRAGAVQGQGWL